MTTDAERHAREAKARALIAACEAHEVTCAALALLDPEGRRALEGLAEVRPASKQTWMMVVYGLCYRAAHRGQGSGNVDPFGGWHK